MDRHFPYIMRSRELGQSGDLILCVPQLLRYGRYIGTDTLYMMTGIAIIRFSCFGQHGDEVKLGLFYILMGRLKGSVRTGQLLGSLRDFGFQLLLISPEFHL